MGEFACTLSQLHTIYNTTLSIKELMQCVFIETFSVFKFYGIE